MSKSESGAQVNNIFSAIYYRRRSTFGANIIIIKSVLNNLIIISHELDEVMNMMKGPILNSCMAFS